MTIAVGVDGSAASQQALSWAIAEGRLRREPVRAVYVWDHAPAAFDLLDPQTVQHGLEALQKHAQNRLAEAVAEVAEGGGVEQLAVRGHPVAVLVEQSRTGDLLVVGSRGHGDLSGALLGSVSQGCARHAKCPVVVIRDPQHQAPRARAWHPDELIEREKAKTARTWEVLRRLGVDEGDEIALEFGYDSGGAAADRVLAEYLCQEIGYRVDIEAAGLTGWTPPISLSPSSLDEWVTRMVFAGHDRGGSAFNGWTATLAAGHDHRILDPGAPIEGRG